MVNVFVPASDFGVDLSTVPEEVTEDDAACYRSLVCLDVTREAQERIENPSLIYPGQKELMALHWHPEHVPMDMIRRRIDRMFPNRTQELIIPTQHNELLEWDDYAGTEIDCVSIGFNRKVQLLAHFRASAARDAATFKSMLHHTFLYRQRQFYDFIFSVIDRTMLDRVEEAIRRTGVGADVVAFTRFFVGKLNCMVEQFGDETPPAAIKNKLVADYFDTLRADFPYALVDRAQVFLKAVKKIVKREYPIDYFYAASEIIEEVRGLGGGVIIPHPEQFWPILLADYDVDGYEVWNPQSREYTGFLIDVAGRANRSLSMGRKPLLVMMGDDCHMGEKTREPRFQRAEKVNREIGYQPAWDELGIEKSLGVAGMNRSETINEYRARLG